MDFSFSKLISRIFDKHESEISILMVGLNGAGKSSILQKLEVGEIATISEPKSGFSIEKAQYKNFVFYMWDLGGQESSRKNWKQYLHNARAVVFVLDSSDREHIREVKEGLHGIASEHDLRSALFLICANKQDLPNAMTVAEITDNLGLDHLRQAWSIMAGSATSGDGLHGGFEWLTSNLRSRLGL